MDEFDSSYAPVADDPFDNPMDIGLEETMEVTAPGVVLEQPASGLPAWLPRVGLALLAGGAVYAMNRSKNRTAYALGTAGLVYLLAPALLAKLTGRQVV